MFVDSNEIQGTKIDFITNNYSDIWNVLIYPLIITILLITIFPFVTYLAYWANLYFTDLRKNLKNKVEKNQLLTVEESAQIKLDIQSNKIKFNELLKDKNDEIVVLKEQVRQLLDSKNETSDSLKKKSKSALELIQEENMEIDNEVLFNKLLNDTQIKKDLRGIVWGIETNGKASASSDVLSDSVAILRANNIIKKDSNSKDYFTDLGNKFLNFHYKH